MARKTARNAHFPCVFLRFVPVFAWIPWRGGHPAGLVGGAGPLPAGGDGGHEGLLRAPGAEPQDDLRGGRGGGGGAGAGGLPGAAGAHGGHAGGGGEDAGAEVRFRWIFDGFSMGLASFGLVFDGFEGFGGLGRSFHTGLVPRKGDLEHMMAWAGQSAGLALEQPAGEVVQELWSQVVEMLEGPRSKI